MCQNCIIQRKNLIIRNHKYCTITCVKFTILFNGTELSCVTISKSQEDMDLDMAICTCFNSQFMSQFIVSIYQVKWVGEIHSLLDKMEKERVWEYMSSSGPLVFPHKKDVFICGRVFILFSLLPEALQFANVE